MKKYNCETEHAPPHSHGDCIRACVATLLGSDDVPHVFTDKNVVESWVKLRNHLIKNHAKNIVLFNAEDPWQEMSFNNPGIPYMLLCRNSAGNHAVVCRNDEVIHDPAAIKRDILGPTSHGVWVVGVIVNA